MQQQDAHEFLNYLLNTIGDLLDGKKYDIIMYAKRRYKITALLL